MASRRAREGGWSGAGAGAGLCCHPRHCWSPLPTGAGEVRERCRAQGTPGCCLPAPPRRWDF